MKRELSDGQLMLIGLVTPTVTSAGGGVATVVNELSRTLGLEVTTYGHGTKSWANGKPLPFGYQPNLHEKLRSDGVEVVHSHGIWLHHSIEVMRWGGPRVVSPHGSLDGWALEHSKWKKRFARFLFEERNLRGAKCIHALNVRELEAIREYGLYGPVAVIPNGVGLPTLDRGNQRSSRSDSLRRLLYLGRIHPKKGLFELLRWWVKFKPAGWHLDIAGWDDGGHEAGLRGMAVEGVAFVGPKFGAEKDKLFRSADAFILPSRSEGLPMAVLEAWAYGVPVAMTRECYLPEGFASGAAAEITTEGDGLLEFLSLDDEVMADMGRKGRELVETQYTWARVADEFMAVYRWAAGRGPEPPCVVR